MAEKEGGGGIRAGWRECAFERKLGPRVRWCSAGDLSFLLLDVDWLDILVLIEARFLVCHISSSPPLLRRRLACCGSYCEVFWWIFYRQA